MVLIDSPLVTSYSPNRIAVDVEGQQHANFIVCPEFLIAYLLVFARVQVCRIH